MTWFERNFLYLFFAALALPIAGCIPMVFWPTPFWASLPFWLMMPFGGIVAHVQYLNATMKMPKPPPPPYVVRTLLPTGVWRDPSPR